MGTPDTSALTLLVADDHAIVREGLKRLLETSGRPWRVVEAGSGHEALDLLRRQAVDLGIFDLSMPGMDGLDLLRRARALCPSLPALILTMRAEEHYALRAFQAGARGYVTKDTVSRELVSAIDKVLSGGWYVSPALADRVVMQLAAGAQPVSLEALSNRELEILRRLADGQRATDIADALHLSAKTVSTHKSRIQEKLNLTGTAALLRFALEHGLGSDDAQPGPPKP